MYWAPMLAYQKYGISSFNYSDAAMAPYFLKGLIEQSRDLCEPKLYVIDLRILEAFESRPKAFNRGYFHCYSDAFSYGIKRFNMIHYAYPYISFDAKEIELQLDLLSNHSTFYTTVLSKIKNRNNSNMSMTKGFEFKNNDISEVVLNPYDEVTEKKDISKDGQEILKDLLKYIRENDLNVLFVISPFSLENEDTKKIYNRIYEIVVNEYGFNYIDTNEYYDEIGLDGNTDFYNVTHVNILGAEKYTNWLAKWLKENYNLMDHRGEEAFTNWDVQSHEFNKEWEELREYYMRQIQ